MCRVLQQAEIIGIKCNGCLLHGGVEFVFGQVARPDDDDLPAGLNQSVIVLLVPFAVAGYLGLPKGGVGFRQYELFATFMPVPETAVDKDSRSVLAHHYVRLAGHALDIEPVPVSVRPQPFPDRYLRLGRLAVDMRHAAVALDGCQDIGRELFELLSLLFKRFDSLQICLFYGR